MLLDRAQAGSETAAGELFATATGRLATYVHARLGPVLRAKLEVDDVVQETLVNALEALDQFDARGSGSFAGWLCRIAEHVICNLAAHHAAARRTAKVETDRVSRILALVRESIDGPATQAAISDDGRELCAALDQLPEELRTVVLLRHFQDCTLDEIAEATQMSASAVRRALGRAIRELGTGLGRLA